MDTRRDRRVRRRRHRGIAIALAVMSALGLTAGLAGTAGAAKTNGSGPDNCGKYDNSFDTFNRNNSQGNNVTVSHVCTN